MCNCDKCQAQRNEMESEKRRIKIYPGRVRRNAQGQAVLNPNPNTGVPPPTPNAYGLDIRGRICVTVDKFVHNSYRLPKDTGTTLLQKVAKTIFNMSEDIDYVKLVGHTDISGTDGYNQSLGMKRALSVKKFLEDCFKRLEWLEKGLSKKIKIEMQSKGESQATKSTDAENRRVEIEIAYRPAPQSKLPHCDSFVMPPPPATGYVNNRMPPPPPPPPYRPNPPRSNSFQISGQVGFNTGSHPSNRRSAGSNISPRGRVQTIDRRTQGGQPQSRESSVLSEIMNESETL